MESDRQPLVQHQEDYNDHFPNPYGNPYDQAPHNTTPNGPPFADKSTPVLYPPQPYAQPYYPLQDPVLNGQAPFAGERFRPKNGVRDPFFLVLFLVQLAGLVGISAYSVYSWFHAGGPKFDEDSNEVTEDIGAIASNPILIAIIVGGGLLISTLYFLLLRLFTTFMMHVSLIFTVILNAAICGYYAYRKLWVACAIFGVVALFSLLGYFGVRKRIPLASLLLKTVMDITTEHLAVYVVALVSLVIQAALAVWVVFACIASLEVWTGCSSNSATNTQCNTALGWGFVIYMGITYIYTSITIGNIVSATLAGGPFGCWYYIGSKNSPQMPSWPTASAFGRATTSSLGSIAFGSLIVTVLEIIRGLLDFARQDSDGVLSFLACCAECFVACIEDIVESFNRYAYIEIALYGKSYVKAAKDTWRLIKDRGVDAIINDSIVSNVLAWGALCNGLLLMLAAFLWVHFKEHESFQDNGGELIAAMVFAFVVGVQLEQTLASVFESGVSTIFVGLAEDPGVLAIRSPQLFGLIADRYPQVVEGVPGGVRV
ncbi:unnamed protein product [Peniophora sp. CBMAI 1063]|nr:unnamed protein product [Peniophora sp. CBMAI 1063]